MNSYSLGPLIVLAGALTACAGLGPAGADPAWNDEHHLAQPATSGASGTMDDIVKDMPCARHRKMGDTAKAQARGDKIERDTRSMPPQRVAMLGQHCQ